MMGKKPTHLKPRKRFQNFVNVIILFDWIARYSIKYICKGEEKIYCFIDLLIYLRKDLLLEMI